MVGSLATVALCLGLAATAAGVLWMDRRIHAEAQIRFDNHAARLEEAIKRRFSRPLAGFHGIRSFMQASTGPVNREAFHAWVASRDMPVDFPGVRGMGFVQRVDRAALPQFIANERADHAPEFSVRTSGDKPDLYVIKYIEPLSPNRQAWGLDLGSEAVRREAVERAARTGKPALSGHIALVQDGAKRPGFLYMLPVYNPGFKSASATPEERLTALRGLIYAPIVLAELMQDVDGAADKQLDFEVFDGSADPESVPLYDHDQRHVCASRISGTRACESRPFQVVKAIEIGGRTLSVSISGTSSFDATVDYSAPGWAGLAGSLLSGLLATTIWLLGLGRARSVDLAERMTMDLRRAKLQAEATLREHQALLRTVNLHSMVSEADRKGLFTDVNEAFCQVTGYSREELIGQPDDILRSAEHDDAFWEQLRHTTSAGKPWSAEVCIKTKSGELRWLNSVVAPFTGEDGTVEKYVSLNTDITARRCAEADLLQQAKRFELAIEGGNDGLWDWIDVYGQEEWWSPQFYRLLGYEPGEIPASLVTFDEMLHPDYRESTFDALRAALQGIRLFDLDYPLRTKSGEYRWFHSRAKVYRNERGLPIRMAGSLQDIHEQRLAKDQIRERNEQLDAIFTLSPDGFVSFNGLMRVVFVSPAFTRLTGLDASSVVGLTEAEFLQRLLDLSTADTRIASLEDLRVTHSPDGPEGRADKRVVLDMVKPVKRMLQIALHQSSTGEITSVLHLRDVTHETEVDRMKSEFLSMAAHELRTPMASIFGFTELLIHREMPPAKQKDLLGRIHRHSQTMTSILNELLNLARIEARRGSDFKPELADLADLVTEVTQDFQPPDDRTPPELLVPGSGAWVNVDRGKLRQAALNLLANAYKYSPQGGPVRIELVGSKDRGKPSYGLRVTDHGIGLTPEQLQRVGERFYRADKSGNIPGTGLGVSIVKEIIALLGGTMDIRSREGRGTQVTLWLPAAAPPGTGTETGSAIKAVPAPNPSPDFASTAS